MTTNKEDLVATTVRLPAALVERIERHRARLRSELGFAPTLQQTYVLILEAGLGAIKAAKAK